MSRPITPPRSSIQLGVLLADDHPLVLLGARAALARDAIQVVGEARSASELHDALSRIPCSVLVTDLSMPVGDAPDGVVMVQRILVDYPRIPVILMTMMDNIGIIDALLRAGVKGLIDKSDHMDSIALAVRMAATGRTYISPDTRALLGSYRRDIKHGARLSPRQADVLRLISSGLSVSEIAQRNKRSLQTISQQKRDGMRKLGLESDVELFAYARACGLR